jgi:hypothetical protein
LLGPAELLGVALLVEVSALILKVPNLRQLSYGGILPEVLGIHREAKTLSCVDSSLAEGHA